MVWPSTCSRTRYGWPVARDAGVDQVRDVRMRQPGEDGAFAPEPLFAGAADQRDVEQLDGRAALEAAVAALGQPDAAHAALADQRRRAGTRRRSGPPATASARRARSAERAARGIATRGRDLVLGEQRLEVRGERGVARANRRQPGGPLGGRRFPAPRRGTG